MYIHTHFSGRMLSLPNCIDTLLQKKKLSLPDGIDILLQKKALITHLRRHTLVEKQNFHNPIAQRCFCRRKLSLLNSIDLLQQKKIFITQLYRHILPKKTFITHLYRHKFTEESFHHPITWKYVYRIKLRLPNHIDILLQNKAFITQLQLLHRHTLM